MSLFKPVKPVKQEYRDRPTRIHRRTPFGLTRLQHDNYGSKTDWHALCAEVAKDAGHKCERCGYSDKAKPKRRFECHHRIPLSRGGRTMKANLMYLCDDCHQSKHRHTF